jgi:uncharacterized membrane protein
MEMTPEENGTFEARERRLERLVGNTLRAGTMASGVLMAAGFALMLLRPQTQAPAARSLEDLLRLAPETLFLLPTFYLFLGILCLMATPALRVLMTVVTFAAERDWRYVAVSLTVLAVLALSLTLALAG